MLGNPARHTLVFRIVGTEDLPNAVALSSGLGTFARIVGPGLGGLVVALAGAGVAFAVNAVSYLAVVLALLAMRVSELAPFERPARRAGVRAMVAFVLGTRRVTVAFFGVLAPEHGLVQLRRPAAARRPADARCRRRRLRADRGRLRRRRPLRRAPARVGRPREPAAAARRGRRLRRARARAGAAELARRRLRPPLPGRDLLRALGLERPRLAPARGPLTPARPGGKPLLLRLPGRRAGRRSARRLADEQRRDCARVHGRRGLGDRRRRRGRGQPARRQSAGVQPEGRAVRPVARAPRAPRRPSRRRGRPRRRRSRDG